MRCSPDRCPHFVAVLVAMLIPSLAGARPGNLALINLGKERTEVIVSAHEVIKPYLGGWARQEGITAFLLAQSSPNALPSGEVGKELVLLVERIRSGQSSSKELTDLGRLLSVDYLLLLRAQSTHFQARLYSVRLQGYVPQGIETSNKNTGLLVQYINDQTQPTPGIKKKSTRWWLWAVALGLGGLALGFSLANTNDTTGEVRIRVSR